MNARFLFFAGKRRGRSILCQRRTKAQPTQPTLLMHARVDREIIRKSEETSNKDQHIAASSLALHVAQLGMDRVFFMDFLPPPWLHSGMMERAPAKTIRR
jgi:hypothetical protein